MQSQMLEEGSFKAETLDLRALDHSASSARVIRITGHLDCNSRRVVVLSNYNRAMEGTQFESRCRHRECQLGGMGVTFNLMTTPRGWGLPIERPQYIEVNLQEESDSSDDQDAVIGSRGWPLSLRQFAPQSSSESAEEAEESVGSPSGSY